MPFCGGNICVLALLGTTREQYHQPISILAKIDSVLIDAGTNTFHIREVALLHPMDGFRHRSAHFQMRPTISLTSATA